MFSQTFDLSDIPRIFTLGFLELLLSADNAIVLGLVTHSLPPLLRRKALYIGVASAFVLRAAGLLSISYLIRYFWVELLAAAYLVYLSVHHFAKKRKSSLQSPGVSSFWKAVLLVEFFDLAFAIDSIVAGVAFIGPSSAPIHPKLWIVYLGGMLGLLGTRVAAELFSNLIHRFPALGTSAYLLVGWIGFELALNALQWSFPYQNALFWTGIALFFLYGFNKKGSHV